MRLLPALLMVAFTFTGLACSTQRVTLGKMGADADFATCSKLSKRKKYDEAIECLELYKSRYAGTATATEADVEIADTFFDQKDFLLAAESYDSFLRDHPLHARADYAFFRLGLSYLRSTPKAIDRDQEHLDDAIQALQSQLQLFPESAHRAAAGDALEEALNKIARHHFYVGEFYYRTGEYRAAVPRLAEVVQHHSEFPEIGKAFYLLTSALAHLEEFDAARDLYSKMTATLDGTPWAKRTARCLRRATKSAEATDEEKP
ncbi:MAG: outer membrane protein assembly factor BamD [Deltaproteobacteria bacterium]|nr:outer membrane protein assembly factor BamD [Deltaproteobacteria bacterium]